MDSWKAFAEFILVALLLNANQVRTQVMSSYSSSSSKLIHLFAHLFNLLRWFNKCVKILIVQALKVAIFFFSFSIPGKEYRMVRDLKWSGNFAKGAVCENSQSLWHTQETQGPSTSITRSHMPQFFTAFSFRLPSAGGQKCDFCKSHSRRECKVDHSF